MADQNFRRHELTEALWTAAEGSVLDAPEGLDTEYGVILNVVDRIMAMEDRGVVLRALGGEQIDGLEEVADHAWWRFKK